MEKSVKRKRIEKATARLYELLARDENQTELDIIQPDLVFDIIKDLTPVELAKVELVSKTFRRMIIHAYPLYWKYRAQKDFKYAAPQDLTEEEKERLDALSLRPGLEDTYWKRWYELQRRKRKPEIENIIKPSGILDDNYTEKRYVIISDNKSLISEAQGNRFALYNCETDTATVFWTKKALSTRRVIASPDGRYYLSTERGLISVHNMISRKVVRIWLDDLMEMYIFYGFIISNVAVGINPASGDAVYFNVDTLQYGPLEEFIDIPFNIGEVFNYKGKNVCTSKKGDVVALIDESDHSVHTLSYPGVKLVCFHNDTLFAMTFNDGIFTLHKHTKDYDENARLISDEPFFVSALVNIFGNDKRVTHGCMHMNRYIISPVRDNFGPIFVIDIEENTIMDLRFRGLSVITADGNYIASRNRVYRIHDILSHSAFAFRRLVSDKICDTCTEEARYTCKTCQKAMYCSSKCQKQDWETHRNKCK